MKNKIILITLLSFIAGMGLSFFISKKFYGRKINELRSEAENLRKENEALSEIKNLKEKMNRLTAKMDYDKKIYVESLKNIIKKSPKAYISRVKSRKKYVALTFDDGPHPVFTPAIIEVLKKNNIPATFFVVGSQVKKYPNLLRAEILAGHEMGNHTYSHKNLTKLDNFSIVYELETTKDIVKREAGYDLKYFRPSGGQYDSKVLNIAKMLGYKTVLWSKNTKDYQVKDKVEIYNSVVEKIGKGEIILCHDGIEETIAILPEIIEALKKKGYEFVTLTSLIKDGEKK